MSKKPTLQMVADKAGVSRGTVDRVLNGRSHVREEVRIRIMNAVFELGYFLPHDIQGKNAMESFHKPLRLGVLLPCWTDFFSEEVIRGIEDARHELSYLSVSIDILRCQTELPSEIPELLDKLISLGVQGIALCAVNHEIVIKKINELFEKGIPVITFNSDIPDSQRLCFVGQNYKKSGRIAGELISLLTPKGHQIAMAIGNHAFAAHKLRIDGFCERINELGFSSTDIPCVETFNDYSLTYRQITDFIHTMPNLSAIYMANQNVAGCVEAVKDTGMKGKIHIVVHDISETNIRLLKEKRIDFAISQDIYNQGKKPLFLLQDYLQNQKLPAHDEINSSITIICAENIPES